MAIPEVGKPAPALALPGSDGEIVRLCDYLGKAHVVLAFYPFDFSPVCSLELPGLQEQMQRFRDLETVVLGISTDSTHAHQAFAAELGLEFPLLSDFYGKRVTTAYGVLRPEGFSERATFIIDKAGIVRYAEVHDISQVPDVEDLIGVLEMLNNDHD